MSTLILVGQLDSPFVRRVAVTMAAYEQSFELKPLSVYSDFDALLSINPAGSVPVLITEDQRAIADTEAICFWLDERAPFAFLRGTRQEHLQNLEAVATANWISSKAGEAYRWTRFSHDAEIPEKARERLVLQINASLEKLDLLCKAGSASSASLSHTNIAASCAVVFARQIAQHLRLAVTIPTTLAAYLSRVEQHSAFAGLRND